MAELVDAPASGAGDRKVVEVRVLFRAPLLIEDGQCTVFDETSCSDTVFKSWDRTGGHDLPLRRTCRIDQHFEVGGPESAALAPHLFTQHIAETIDRFLVRSGSTSSACGASLPSRRPGRVLPDFFPDQRHYDASAVGWRRIALMKPSPRSVSLRATTRSERRLVILASALSSVSAAPAGFRPYGGTGPQDRIE